MEQGFGCKLWGNTWVQHARYAWAEGSCPHKDGSVRDVLDMTVNHLHQRLTPVVTVGIADHVIPNSRSLTRQIQLPPRNKELTPVFLGEAVTLQQVKRTTRMTIVLETRTWIVNAFSSSSVDVSSLVCSSKQAGFDWCFPDSSCSIESRLYLVDAISTTLKERQLLYLPHDAC